MHDGLWCREVVEGAPLQPGTRVIVVCEAEDDSRDERFAGRCGVVDALFYDDPATQFPASPLLLVRVDGLGEDLFFVDELVVGAPTRAASGRPGAARRAP